MIGVLTDQPTQRNASTYWAVLKKRLIEEGAAQLLTNCKQLRMTAADGKKRLTDVANTEEILRIIQSIPSPKAEPFKIWLAQLGKERIDETADPDICLGKCLISCKYCDIPCIGGDIDMAIMPISTGERPAMEVRYMEPRIA